MESGGCWRVRGDGEWWVLEGWGGWVVEWGGGISAFQVHECMPILAV
jgi:hypothetical protein